MKRRKPQQHLRRLGYGRGRKIKRLKVINKGIVYYPSKKKIKIKKLYKTMRPSTMEKIPKNGWIYQAKYDGSRGVLYLDKKYGAAFINRRDINATPSYPEFFDSTKKLRANQAVLDGEVVAVTKDKPFGDFQKLAQREHVEDGGEILSRSKKNPLKFFAFDILQKDNKDLTALPLSKRKKILDKVIPANHEDIKEMPYYRNINTLKKKLKSKDAEGFIAKKSDSTYQEDKKSKDWLKAKILHENDTVVLGYTKGTGKRKGLIGALLVGVYDKPSGKYEVKSKVGTGFSDKQLKDLTKLLKPDITEKDYIKGRVPASHHYKFVEPKHVVRVQFLRETEEGGYREPRFIALREDIPVTKTHKAIKPLKSFGAKPMMVPVGKDVIGLAKKIERQLRPLSKKIEIAGSIRRKKKKNINDIDIVMIPKDKEKIKSFMRLKGIPIQEGDKKISYKIEGIKTEIYFTEPRSWGGMMYYATGPGFANIGRRTWAKERGMLLNQYGVFNRKTGEYIAGKTERDVFRALKRPYKQPEERG